MRGEATLEEVRLSLALLLALALAPAARAAELRVVQSNVGNVNVPGCNDQVFKLCLRPVEERAAAALRALGADVAGFEEILPPDLCERAPSPNPDNLCSGALEPPSQVARLLGAGYARDCDSRYGWDCLAVRGARSAKLVTRPVQPDCEDDGFTLNTGTIHVKGWPVTAGVAHPSSTDAPCRANQLRDFFGALPARGPAILMGDFNLDPFREDDESVAEWRRWVPSRFKLLSGDTLTSFPCGSSQLDPTGESLDGAVQPCSGPLQSRGIDHVLGRGASGHCDVVRIDGGGGMDHRTQDCRVELAGWSVPRIVTRFRGCRVQLRFRPRPRHLVGVSFRTQSRSVLDRRRPFAVRLRRGEQRVHAQPVLVNGRGPRSVSLTGACAARR